MWANLILSHALLCLYYLDESEKEETLETGSILSNISLESQSQSPSSLCKSKKSKNSPKYNINSLGEMIFKPLKMKCTHCNQYYAKTQDLYNHIQKKKK